MSGFSCFINQRNAEGCNAQLQGCVIHQGQYEQVTSQLSATESGVGAQWRETEQLCLYLHGEIFSGLEGEALTSLMEAYQSGTLSQALAQANGYFSVLIYDKQQQRLIAASDRYGMKPVFIWRESERCRGISSELKTLAVNPDFDLKLDPTALESFTSVGHMLQNQTWFEQAERLSPATIVTVDCASGAFEKTLYWAWSNVVKVDPPSFEEATDTLHALFVQAMSRCLSAVSEPKLAITLSGGLDSRVLLAEATKQFCGTIETFTFGIEGCADSIIAKQVSDIAGVTNHFRSIDNQRWYDGRENGVWTSDGMFNLVHMHTLASVEAISQVSSYLLNGYLGDAVIGGSYLLPNELDKKATEHQLLRKYGHCAKYVDMTQPYYDFACVDPVLLANRGVRFIASGSDLLSDRLHNLKPFMDTDLLDFVYALPDEYRYNSRLYNAMLLKFYPEYFATIPWQNTGKVISVDWKNPIELERLSVKQRVAHSVKGTRFENLARRWYMKLQRSNKDYVSYPKWMREPEFANYMTRVLSQEFEQDGQALFDKQAAKYALTQFLSDYTTKPETIGGWLTLAIYLNQLSAVRDQIGMLK